MFSGPRTRRIPSKGAPRSLSDTHSTIEDHGSKSSTLSSVAPAPSTPPCLSSSAIPQEPDTTAKSSTSPAVPEVKKYEKSVDQRPSVMLAWVASNPKLVTCLAFLSVAVLHICHRIRSEPSETGCDRSLSQLLDGLDLGQYAELICDKGYNRLEDVLHISDDLCVPCCLKHLLTRNN
jgi:hypothetical protein